MMTEHEVSDKVRALLRTELRRRLERSPLPALCQHNHRQPLDYRKSVYGEPNGAYNRISAGAESGIALPVLQTIGLCMLGADSPESWAGTICEEPLDAQRCGYFKHKVSREQIYESFRTEVQDLAWLAEHLPAVSVLLWVLGGAVTVAEPASVVGRLWAWLLRRFGRRPAEKTVDLLVYFPVLDAAADEDRPRALADHRASSTPS